MIAAFLAACGDGDDDEETPETGSGTRSFEHFAGLTEIPVRAQRIVTLQDQNALLPLLELGVRPVASAGQEDGAGGHRFRRTESYDTSEIAFVGSFGEPDLELIAAQNPDLIVGNSGYIESYDALSAIAPTVLIEVFERPLTESLHQFADLVGALDRWEELKRNYDAAIEALRSDLPRPPAKISLSMI